MPLQVKICGLDRIEAVDAAIEAGARWTGFVFYPLSPRNLSPEEAALLTARVTQPVDAVGLFVDPTDDELSAVLDKNLLDMIQLHGQETPERVAEVKALTELPVMKAIKISTSEDVTAASAYFDVADQLLLDAKAPANMEGALPGGNALSFDWGLLIDHEINFSWMLAGGLTPENVAEAVAVTGAQAVDVSSGVEAEPGVKDLAKIAAFMDAAGGL